MEKTKPTESQIEVLMSDWLGNLRLPKEGNYTHKGNGGIKRKTNSSLREYLLGNVKDLDNLDLIKQSRIAAEHIISGVAPRPVKITLGGSGSFHGITDDGMEHINVSTEYFDSTIPNEEKVDILFGLASHEAAHAAYTDNSLTDKYIDKEPKEIQELKHEIWNILEDERIEYLLGESRPGLSDCLGAAKGHYFDRLVEDMKTSGKMPTEPLPKLLAAITQAVRYPSQMTREQVEDNFDELDAVRRTLSPYPLTPEDCWRATDRVMEIIKDTIKKQMQEEQPPQPQQQEQDKNEEQEQNQNQNQEGGEGGSQSQTSQENGGGQGGSNSTSQNEPSTEEITQAIAKALSTQQGQNVMNAIKKDDDKAASGRSRAISNAKAAEFVNDDDSERMSSSERPGGTPDTFIQKPKGNPEIYNDVLRNVRQYIPAMAKALTCRSQESEYVLLSQPRGKLDTNKLVSFMAGNENIFRKSGKVTCSSASVCMLIDESGSMSGERQRAAREAAILVNEAIKRIRNVNFYCYGYTTRNIRVYSENGKTSPWALSDTQADDCTPTGRSMKMAAERIRRYTKDPVLMLVLTDGGADNSDIVIEQDRALRQKGFTPIGVGIHTNYVSNTFKEYIVLEDISAFALTMGQLTKKKLQKMLVRTDSNN